MPISIDRFDKEDTATLDIEAGTQPFRVLQFLAENDEQAFTQTEIHEATGIKRGSHSSVDRTSVEKSVSER
ncbi:MAG: hypothetical protein U5K28_00885 [Halobacteriales archaeon]|nr:hypothetical protein [Halobacteriales archaeon]